jgi:type I restriction enzyme, S subunit
MKDWKYRIFGEAVVINPKVILDRKEIYDFIEMADVIPGRKFVSSSQKRELKGGARFAEGDTLFARITPCLEHGKISQAKGLEKGVGFGSTEFYVFRGKEDETDNDFVYYLSLTEEVREPAIKSMVGASGRQRAQIDVIESLDVLLPPLPTQRKIAFILSAYDNLIENNLEKIKLLEERKQIIYEEWFVTNSINENRIHEKDFEYKPMEELIQYSMNGGWGQETNDGNFTESAFVIRGTDIPDVSRGNFSDLPLRFHSRKNLESRTLLEGDIIIEISNGNINSVGRSFRFDESLYTILKQKIICASFCKMLRPKSIELSYLLAAHIQYIYKTDKMLVYKSQGANGINNFRSENMITEELIPVPKDHILKTLIVQLEPQFKLISNLRHQIKLVTEARDILLPRLMKGLIEV